MIAEALKDTSPDYRVGLPEESRLVYMWDPRVVDGIDEKLFPQFKNYDQRALVLAQDGDLVYIGAEGDNLERARSFVKDYLNPLGFGPNPEDIYSLGENANAPVSDLWLGDASKRKELGKHIYEKVGDKGVLSPYFYNEDFRRFAGDIGIDYSGPDNEEIISRISDKDRFVQFIDQEVGINVGPYEILTGDFETNLRRILNSGQMGDTLYGRGAKGATGLGHYPIDRENVSKMARKMRGEIGVTERVLVQPNYGEHRSPSIIYRVNGGVHQLGPLSSQILDGNNAHVGNLNPGMKLPGGLEGVIEERSRQIFEKARDLGFKGEGGLDWMITKGYGIIPAEINARPTGNTAPAFVQGRFNNNSDKPVYGASFNVVSPTYREFGQVAEALDDLLVTDKNATSGIMPMQTGDLHSKGKMVVVALGESAEESLRVGREGADRLGDKEVQKYLREESIN